MYRKTYMEIYKDKIKNNVSKIIKKYNNYKYYFGVVKASCYGLGEEVVGSIIEGGCNYLAVSSLDEALIIRNTHKEIPILCLGIIDIEDLKICETNNITITISSKEYLDEVLKTNIKLKAHIKLNTGMNRLGVRDKVDFNYIINSMINSNIYLEGIYTHIYNSDDSYLTNKQFNRFETITEDIDLNKIDIVHIGASTTTINYEKRSYCNGCRLGIIMYGLEDEKDELESCFKIKSKVIQINELENETLGYNGTYKANNKELIAVVPIGYADGIIRKYKNAYVYINDKEYKIVGNICMDMLFIKIDETVKVNDIVEIIKDNDHINYLAKHLDTISYEIPCNITKRVPRVYL